MAAWSNILKDFTTAARESRLLRFAGRAAVPSPRALRAITGMGNLVSKKSFMIPFGIGAFGIGMTRGFGQSVYNDPMSRAWTTGIMNTTFNPQIEPTGGNYPWGAPKYQSVFKDTYPANYGRPLGYYSRTKNYNTAYGPQWQPGSNDPLAATGELMLATFATRHGR
jgi:hypothetical protein